jgi:D-proline reductase (dithiol) PrdB
MSLAAHANQQAAPAFDHLSCLDAATRSIVEAWTEREQQVARDIPFSPLRKPLSSCTVALVSSAGLSLRGDKPFDAERERQDPWWGDPSFREIPLGTTEKDIRISHLHIDPAPITQDLDVTLPLRRLGELAAEGFVGRAAERHFSIMGYILRPDVLLGETAPAMAARMRAESVDAALLVPV